MPTFAINSVVPSGFAFATTSAPITPPAPPRFSTTTGCPHSCCSFTPTVRAVMSVPPPGANGTTKVTDLAGQVCASKVAGTKRRIASSLDILILLGEYRRYLMSMDLDHTLIALADDTRRSILKRLAAGEARVTEVAAPFGISLNSVSKHIRLLERAGLVRRRISGRDHFLALEPRPFDDLAQWLRETRVFWTTRLDKLEAALRAADAIAKAAKPSLRGKGK